MTERRAPRCPDAAARPPRGPRREDRRVRRLADADPVRGHHRGAPRRPDRPPGCSTCRTWASWSSRDRDAGAALAGALVTDPPALAVGRAHYSMICAPDGGILDDLIVYRLAEDRFMVVANASTPRVVSDALAERLDGFRAVLDDRSLATGLVAVQGPRSLDILGPLTELDLAAIRYYGIAEGVVAGIPPRSRAPATPARTGSSCSSTSTGWASCGTPLLEAGPAARPGARGPRRPRHAAARGGHAALRQRARPVDEPVRGRPRAGRQARRSPATSSAGPRWRRSSRDGVRRQLVGLVMRGRGIARHGYPVLAAEVEPGTRRPAARRTYLGDDVAHARDGRSRWPTSPPARCRTRYDAGRGDPRDAGRRRGRAAAVLQAPGLSPQRVQPSRRTAATPRRRSPDGPRRPALHQGARVGPRRGRRGHRGHHPVRRGPAGRHRVRRAARRSGRRSSSSRRSASSSRSRP